MNKPKLVWYGNVVPSIAARVDLFDTVSSRGTFVTSETFSSLLLLHAEKIDVQHRKTAIYFIVFILLSFS